MSESSLQDLYSPGGLCFGCGPANPRGLRLKSFAQGTAVVAAWQPETHHEAFPDMLNGGIIGTLLDCHCNWTAAWHLLTRDQLVQPPCTVTSEYAIKLLRPTPTASPVELSAHVVENSGDRVVVEGTLSAAGRLRATCRGIFVAVKPGHPAYAKW